MKEGLLLILMVRNHCHRFYEAINLYSELFLEVKIVIKII